MVNLPRRNWNNFFLGLIVAVLPWLGLPFTTKKIILFLAGVLISLFSLTRYRHEPAPKMD